MRIQLPNSQDRSLLEVEITLHPEALKHLLFDRHGGLWLILRVFLAALAVYTALGFQTALPQFFPELWLQPLVIILAYLACRSPLPVALTAALAAGIALDAELVMPLGAETTVLVITTAAAALLYERLGGMKQNGGATAIIIGGMTTALYTLAHILFLGGGAPFSPRAALLPAALGIGVLLNAFALAPLIFFCLDRLDGRGEPKL